MAKKPMGLGHMAMMPKRKESKTAMPKTVKMVAKRPKRAARSR